MAKRGHHTPFQHPWQRDHETRHGWAPRAVAIRILLPATAAEAPAETPRLPEVQRPGPPPFDPRTVTLENVLKTFQGLPNPQSRVFGGFYRPAEGATAAGDPFPMVSGIASPGSKVQVVFSDDAGIRQQDTVVHSDMQGYWMASMQSKASLLPPRWIQVSITPPTWGGDTEPVEFLVSFPGEELTTSGHIRGIAAGGLIGTVLPVRKVASTPEDAAPAW